jgi:hypothetical protein
MYIDTKEILMGDVAQRAHQLPGVLLLLQGLARLHVSIYSITPYYPC